MSIHAEWRWHIRWWLNPERDDVAHRIVFPCTGIAPERPVAFHLYGSPVVDFLLYLDFADELPPA
jgi:hypothetical protein